VVNVNAKMAHIFREIAVKIVDCFAQNVAIKLENVRILTFFSFHL